MNKYLCALGLGLFAAILPLASGPANALAVIAPSPPPPLDPVLTPFHAVIPSGEDANFSLGLSSDTTQAFTVGLFNNEPTNPELSIGGGTDFELKFQGKGNLTTALVSPLNTKLPGNFEVDITTQKGVFRMMASILANDQLDPNQLKITSFTDSSVPDPDNSGNKIDTFTLFFHFDRDPPMSFQFDILPDGSNTPLLFDSVPITAVPEPASLTLLGGAMIGLGLARRRKRG